MKFTDEELEILSDWRFRINSFYHIINKQGQKQLFRENWIQKQINNSKSKRKLILKYRQGGVTTGELIKMLDYVCFNKSKNVCVMADERGNMEKIFNKVRYAHKYMPKRFQPELDKGGGSKYEMRFPELDSTIFCDLEGRGGTINWLHISEAAFAKPERIRATLEAVPKDGIVTFETTPNGMGNHYYKRWIKEPSIYDKLFFPWFLHPDYQMDGELQTPHTSEETEFIKKTKQIYKKKITDKQILWRRAKLEDLGEMFYQEYPEDDISCFLTSGDSAFDLMKIKKYLDESIDPLLEFDVGKIFKEYDKTKTYVIGADTAEGVGGDYSVATVFEVQSMQQVATIRSNRLKPKEFAREIELLAKRYWSGGRMWPLVAVERNNHGHSVLLELEEYIRYPNLYYYKDTGEKKIGWLTDKITRPIMINSFIDGVENGTVTLNCRETLGECLTLINNDGKIEAKDGDHDDCIIAASIAIQMAIKLSSNLDLYDDIESKILI